MVLPADYPRPAVFKVRRDTIALVLAATTTTVALSNAIHARRALSIATTSVEHAVPSVQHWTGDLADVSTGDVIEAVPFTSASLVVPQSELALPRMPVRTLVKLRGCEGSACVARPSAPTAPRRQTVTPQREAGLQAGASVEPAANRTSPKHETSRSKPSFMSRLNPLNHLPDMATVKRPFASAGDAVTGWFKRF